MVSRITRKKYIYDSQLLDEDSKKTLISYNMMQLKREQLISPAQSTITPLDLLDDMRSKLKLSEDSLKEAKGKLKKLNGQTNILISDKKQFENLNADYDRRFNNVKIMIQKKLDDTSEFDQVLNINVNNKVKLKAEPETSKDQVLLRFNQDRRRSQSVNPEPRTSRPKHTRDSQFGTTKEKANPLAPKIKRSCENQESLKTPLTTKAHNNIEVRKSKDKRSASASWTLDDDSDRRRLTVRSPHIFNSLNSSDFRNKTSTEIAWTQGRAIAECFHKFKPYRTLMGTCAVCNRQINIMSKVSQCDSCKVCAHESCKNRVPLPCLPASSFSNTLGKDDSRRALPDFCPTNPPFIPALLIRCIFELEHDRLKTEGIYQMPGSKEDVLRLYKEFSKCVPNLILESTQVITDCIKMFLRKLKEPLIPRSSYNEFMQSADDDEKLVEAIEDLPDTNRDTLAYLCLHLQKVALNSRVNKISVEDLAASLCQSILSSNVLSPSGYVSKNNDPFDEAVRQRFVLERLLTMPADFWSDYLNTRTDSKGFSLVTPTSRQAVMRGEVRPHSIRSNSDCSVIGSVSHKPSSHFTRRFSSN